MYAQPLLRERISTLNTPILSASDPKQVIATEGSKYDFREIEVLLALGCLNI